ncbi:MAG: N-acetylmuramoyl-L-alanine amidase [Desulfobacterales bacterium]
MLYNRKTYFSFILAICMLSVMWPRGLPAATARDKYYQAEACYKKLRHNPKIQKYRDKWLSCIKKFDAVYRHDPGGPWAAAGLYMSGKLYGELYKRSFRPSDKKTAIDIFNRIIKRFPKSKYKQMAESAIRNSSAKKTAITALKQPEPEENDTRAPEDSIEAEIEKLSSAQSTVKTNLKASEGETATISGLRFWSNPSYTRVVVDADNEVSYAHRLLKQDSSIKKPKRLYVDLNNSKLGKDITKVVPINDDLLIDARAGQYESNSVRVVVDIKSFETYKIFSIKNPFRIVIDVWGTAAESALPPIRADQIDTKIPPGALAKQLALGVRRIVIDPGHGGRDYGAPGYLKGVHEKNVSLELSRRLAKKIREELGCEVIMTRNSDMNLTLEERTAIANTKNADLFISIHTNAVRNRSAYGIETFFLNLATDNDAIMTAARENATSTRNISDLQTILIDLMQNAKINESSRLAVHVQNSMSHHLRKHFSQINSKGVKQAPFYVLLGAQMPAILIEASFISNPRECKRLNSTRYQDRMSEAIVQGIRGYIIETNPTALMEQNPNQDLMKSGG